MGWGWVAVLQRERTAENAKYLAVQLKNLSTQAFAELCFVNQLSDTKQPKDTALCA